MIVDDHEIFREGLVALLKGESDVKVVAQAADGETALERLVLFKPKVVILDVSLPGTNGAELARKIRNRLPDTRIVALSMHAEPQFLELMLRAGAAAYVVKNDAFKELVSAIRHSVGDAPQPYLSTSAAESAQRLRERPGTTRKATLSEREEEVLRLLAGGMPSREIAERLGVSPKTVDTYRRRMMEKLEVGSNAELVKRAIALGLSDFN
jgi:DNA-binding NarL/FixJ family response regulator